MNNYLFCIIHYLSINNDNFIQILKLYAHRNQVYNINSTSAVQGSTDAFQNSAHVAPTHNLPHVASTATDSPPPLDSNSSTPINISSQFSNSPPNNINN